MVHWLAGLPIGPLDTRDDLGLVSGGEVYHPHGLGFIPALASGPTISGLPPPQPATATTNMRATVRAIMEEDPAVWPRSLSLPRSEQFKSWASL